jgi:hypothetical protein
MLLATMPTLRRVVLPSIAGIAFAAAGTALRADPIPQEWLTAQHNACIQSCAAAKNAAALCQTSCSCIDQGFLSSMTKAEYQTLNDDVAKRTPIPPALSDKVQTIADRCKVHPSTQAQPVQPGVQPVQPGAGQPQSLSPQPPAQ